MSLINSVIKNAVSSAVKTAASTAKTAAEEKKKSGSSGSGKTASAVASTSSEGVTSRIDRQLMNEADLAAIQNYSAAAKSASAAGDRAGVTSAHAAAEAIRAKYGYSGGQLGDEYIPLEGAVSVTAPKANTGAIRDLLRQEKEVAGEQHSAAIDYATAQGITALQEAREQTERRLQTLRDQTDAEERMALDNQALYAEVRGDRGGVGREQYNSIQNTAAQNRLAVNRQQTELADQTRRQMEQLRAEGEFQKADALLELSQNYLSQLASLERWAAEYDFSAAQFQAELAQWRQEFARETGELLGSYNGRPTLAAQKQSASLAQAQQSLLAEAGEALLKAGIQPSAAQLAAMGMTAEQARSYIRTKAAKGTGSSSGGTSSSGSAAGKHDYEGLFAAAGKSMDARSYIANNYKAFGFTSSTGLWDAYQSWSVKQTDNGLAQLTHDREKGTFTWNGETYPNLQQVLKAIWTTDLTDKEAALLEQRFAEYGYEIAFP